MSKKYIEREVILEKLFRNRFGDAVPHTWAAGHNNGIDTAITIVNMEAAADLVKVVRCESCKHRTTDTFGRTVCSRTFTWIEVNLNDFCSYGENQDKELDSKEWE